MGWEAAASQPTKTPKKDRGSHKGDITRWNTQLFKTVWPAYRLSKLPPEEQKDKIQQLAAEAPKSGGKRRTNGARAKAIVKATTHYKDAKIVAEVSKDLGEAMPGLEISKIPPLRRGISNSPYSEKYATSFGLG